MLRILLTGRQGFLGSILYELLNRDYTVITLSRSVKSTIVADLTADDMPNLPTVDLVVHNAGYAHLIPKNQAEVDKFYNINVNGTRRLLSALEKTDKLPTTIVYISTVAVYGLSSGQDIQESQTPQPDTPYAKSKYQAENLLNKWGEEHSVSVVILRLPLIVGKQPKGNLAALHSAVRRGWFVKIRQNTAKKSAVVAFDIAKLIPSLHAKSGIFNLSDGHHPSVNEVAEAIATQLNKRIKLQLPLAILQLAAKVGDYLQKFHLPFPVNSIRLSKISHPLTFSDKKARKELGWSPTPVIEWLKNNPL